ncbi:helix-turn-helix domain-containing protein [Collinsella sp. zg1085]|uniref:helix-turn-helix domain-containing protein n=1 Tax=Collinsella sp. zg1085 TaxID=2844380 RepID=UPI001C0E26B6|nr:helix-turn-helix domain-containing protein [Collinsella sp. zg1085]QWT17717.1 helix-turn-helix domain-containing protein [Collinsella sp. zg1085]
MASGHSRNTYDAETRRRAVKVLASGSGHRALAAALGLPEATARQWARSYAVGGASAVMNAGATHRIYPFALKLSVVKDRVENGLSVRDVMIKYGVPSESSVKTWCRQYRDQGEGALIDRPRGRKPKQKAE